MEEEEETEEQKDCLHDWCRVNEQDECQYWHFFYRCSKCALEAKTRHA